MGMTVFPIMEALDPKSVISYKLVRDATHFTNGKHLKDLDRLNRDLSKVKLFMPNNLLEFLIDLYKFYFALLFIDFLSYIPYIYKRLTFQLVLYDSFHPFHSEYNLEFY